MVNVRLKSLNPGATHPQRFVPARSVADAQPVEKLLKALSVSRGAQINECVPEVVF